MAESSGPRHGPQWQDALVSELRALSPRLDVPPAAEQATTVRGPAKLGRPDAVTVSDGGRVATLIYDRTPYGQVRLDEFDGHLDPVYFEKFIHLGNVTEVRLNGTKGLWVTGPQEIVYVRSDGMVCRPQPG